MAVQTVYKVVCNSSPIINLSKIKQLELIKKLYGNVYIPYAVYEELITNAFDKKYIEDIEILIENKVIIVQKVKNISLIKALKKDLDYGEAEVISLALEIGAGLIIIDENDARKIAEIYGLNKTGFIGILIKAKTKGYISSVLENLNLAMEEGFWINKELYEIIAKNFKD